MSKPSAAETTAEPVSATLPNAGVVHRIGALVYDCFLLFGVLFVATLLVTLVSSDMSIAETPGDGEVVTDLQQTLPGSFMAIYLGSVIVLFYCWFWRRNGQTLGMQAWRLRLVDTTGAKPSLAQCLLRCAVAPLSLLLGGLGYWWIWLDRDNCSWHDRLSSTRVQLLPKTKKK